MLIFFGCCNHVDIVCMNATQYFWPRSVMVTEEATGLALRMPVANMQKLRKSLITICDLQNILWFFASFRAPQKTNSKLYILSSQTLELHGLFLHETSLGGRWASTVKLGQVEARDFRSNELRPHVVRSASVWGLGDEWIDIWETIDLWVTDNMQCHWHLMGIKCSRIAMSCTLEGFYVSMYQFIKNTLILSTFIALSVNMFFPNT